MKEIKILIVDDHPMVRFGIKQLIESEKDIKVIGEASNGKEALSFIKEQMPDVILMDIKMPEMSGIDATKKIFEMFSDAKILALSMFSDSTYILNILEAGAAGYVLKNADKDELAEAIRVVNQGDSFFTDEVAKIMMDELVKSSKSIKKNDTESLVDSILSDKEKEIYDLILQGFDKKSIEDMMGMYSSTLRNYLYRIRNKFQKAGFYDQLKNVTSLK
ncbi:MAG: DNA-binding response regulator [Chitinophagaceae bacterium]|nr:MAG: DNA-binding response regulator [Chitinophagaceae bacterium]